MSWLVCEDGAEYTQRFERFLGADFRFVRATCFSEALRLCEGAQGLLLDLDFGRTPPELLVDAAGERGASPARELAEVQGILILRALRARGVRLPALLFADLDDPERTARPERELRPLQVVPREEGLPAIARRLRELAAHRQGD
jgi:hypothetical protein